MSDSDDDLTLFVDRSLGGRMLVGALRAAGMNAEAHDDHFPQATEDAVWITEVTRRGWVILTKDKKIAYRHLEQLAVRTSGSAMFCLVGRADLGGPAMAEAFVLACPAIRRHVAKAKRPYIAKVDRRGRVKAWRAWGDEE